MKLLEKHISNLFVALAIFLVFGNAANAHVVYQENSKLAVISELQDENKGKPVVYDALTIGEVSQTISKNEYLGLNFVAPPAENQNFISAHEFPVIHCYYSSKDKRELIFKHLFPFHFFW